MVERFNAELGALEAQCQGYHRQLMELERGGGRGGGGGGGGGGKKGKEAKPAQIPNARG